MEKHIDPFKEMEWCETHAIWFAKERKTCPCCEAGIVPHLRGETTVLKGSDRWNELKKAGLLLPHFMVEDDVLARNNSEYAEKANLEKNPAHICMGTECNKYLGHRGFCSQECHDEHYSSDSKQNTSEAEE